MLALTLLALALLHLEGLTTVQSCSPLPGDTKWSMEKTLYNAPAVVVASDVYHSISGSHNTWMADAGKDDYANFDVHCVMKSGGYNLGSTIVINNGAIRFSSMCDTTFTNVGTKYIVGIKESTAHPGRYEFYEPNVLTEGAYQPTQANLNAAANVCGLDATSCPDAVDATPTTCVDGDGNTVARPTTTTTTTTTTIPITTTTTIRTTTSWQSAADFAASSVVLLKVCILCALLVI